MSDKTSQMIVAKAVRDQLENIRLEFSIEGLQRELLEIRQKDPNTIIGASYIISLIKNEIANLIRDRALLQLQQIEYNYLNTSDNQVVEIRANLMDPTTQQVDYSRFFKLEPGESGDDRPSPDSPSR